MVGATVALVVCTLLSTGAPVPAWPTGVAHRVGLADSALEGELRAVTGRALFLRDGDADIELPLHAVHRLQRAEAGGNHAIPGLLAGFAVGAAGALVANASTGGDGGPAIGLGGTWAAAAVGALAGSFVGSRVPAPRWAPVAIAPGHELLAGERVVVWMHDGTLRHGRVLELREGELLLVPPGGDRAVALDREQVDWVERSRADRPGRGQRVAGFAALGALVGVGSAGVIAILDEDREGNDFEGLENFFRSVGLGTAGLVLGAIYGALVPQGDPERVELGASPLPVGPGVALALQGRF